MQTGNNYVHGTAAEKIQYDVYRENKVLRAKRAAKVNGREKLKVVGYVLVTFALFFFVMYRYALITELNYEIDKQNKMYEAIRNDNLRLKVEIDKQMNLNTIKELAEKRLGMQKPDKSQIIPIKVPKSDFTELANVDRNVKETNSNMFAALRDKVVRLAGFLY